MTSLGHNYIHIYSDGACSGNQLKENKGGWAAVMISNNKKKEISGCECNTTNQRMELTAAIKALRSDYILIVRTLRIVSMKNGI